MSLLEYALKYARLGFSVIPCVPPTKDSEGRDKKQPRISWIEFQKRKASEDEIKGWFKKYPDSRIGIVTGQISNLFIVDCDDEDAHIKFESEILPESVITPKAKSPHGYHYYFKHKDGLRNKTKMQGMGLDTRGEGGFIMAPPNPGLNGDAYAWLQGLDPWTVTLAEVPASIETVLLESSTTYGNSIDIPNNNLNTLEKDKNLNIKIANGVPEEGDQARNILDFSKGSRAQTIFHIANCLVKGGMPTAEIQQLLIIIGQKVCNPPYPANEVIDRIKSALNRSERIATHLTEEVREWVMSTDVHFMSTDVHKELGLSTRVHKKNVSTILKRLSAEGVIEKTGNKNGQWRKVDRNYAEQMWWNDDGQPLPVRFPLELQEFAKVYNGNIILLEGQKSQGKSAFAIEFCRLNRLLFPGKILYQNVEMADSELLERFRAYGDVMSIDEWRQSVTFIKQTSEWWDKVQPDGLNVIDYFVEYKEPYLLAQYVWNVHQKLKQGIALILVQRDPFKPYPSGGRAVRDIPRVIVSLIKHKLRIEDIKSWYQTPYGNPNGLTRKYKQVNWWQFKPETGWEFEEEEKYAAFRR